jgi:hypothetical protein
MDIEFKPSDQRPEAGCVFRVTTLLSTTRLSDGLVPTETGCVIFYCLGLRAIDEKTAEGLGAFIPALFTDESTALVTLYRRPLKSVIFPLGRPELKIFQVPSPQFFNMDEEAARAEIAEIKEAPPHLVAGYSEFFREIQERYVKAGKSILAEEDGAEVYVGG